MNGLPVNVNQCFVVMASAAYHLLFSYRLVDWSAISCSANGTYTKTAITTRIGELKRQFEFPEGSFEYKMLTVLDAMDRETQLKREIKLMSTDLHEKTKMTIEQLTIEQALALLETKWTDPVKTGIFRLPDDMLDKMKKRVYHLFRKYQHTFSDVGDQIDTTERKLSNLLKDLTSDSFTSTGLQTLSMLLGGNNEQ